MFSFTTAWDANVVPPVNAIGHQPWYVKMNHFLICPIPINRLWSKEKILFSEKRKVVICCFQRHRERCCFSSGLFITRPLGRPKIIGSYIETSDERGIEISKNLNINIIWTNPDCSDLPFWATLFGHCRFGISFVTFLVMVDPILQSLRILCMILFSLDTFMK